MGYPHFLQVIKPSRTVNSVISSEIIPQSYKGQNYTNSVRQYHYHSLSQSHGRSSYRTYTACQSHLGGVSGQQCDDICAPSTRNIERGGGLTFSAPRQVRVDITPEDISSSRLHVGTTHRRSFQFVSYNPPTFLQQQIFRSTNRGSGCVSTDKLGVTQQLCESPFSTHSTSVTSHPKSKCEGNSDSPVVACPAVVSDAEKVDSGLTGASSSSTSDMSKNQRSARTSAEPEVAFVRLEDLWKDKLIKRQWSERPAAQIALSLAPSTLKLYNFYIHDFYLFCLNHHFSFPTKDTVALSNFLCYVADSSTKPRSKLKTVCAALSCYYEAYELLNIVHNPDIVRLTQALVK